MKNVFFSYTPDPITDELTTYTLSGAKIAISFPVDESQAEYVTINDKTEIAVTDDTMSDLFVCLPNGTIEGQIYPLTALIFHAEGEIEQIRAEHALEEEEYRREAEYLSSPFLTGRV